MLKTCLACKSVGDVRIKIVRTIRPKGVDWGTTRAGQTGARKTCGVEHARAPCKAIRGRLCMLMQRELLWTCDDVLYG